MRLLRRVLCTVLSLSLTVAFCPFALAAEETEQQDPVAEQQLPEEADATQDLEQAPEESSPADEEAAQAQSAEEPTESELAEVGETATIADGLYYIALAENTQLLLDVQGGATTDANIQLHTANYSAAEKFWVTTDEQTNTTTITCLKSNLSVAQDGSNVAQAANPDDGAASWQVTSTETGYFFTNAASGLQMGASAATSGSNVECSKGGSAFTLTSAVANRLLDDGEYILSSNLSNTMVADIASGSTESGANVQLYNSNMTEAQRFTFTYDEQTGFYEIVNTKSGLALDVAGGNCASGTNVQQYRRNNTLAQRWIIAEGDGGIVFLSAIHPGFALDVYGGGTANKTNIQLYTAHYDVSQRWRAISTNVSVEPGAELQEDTWYEFECAKDSAYVFDIASGSSASDANVQLYKRNGTVAQLFKFEKDGDYYRILTGAGNKSLEVTDGNLVPRTNVCQSTIVQGAERQLWSARANDDGSYTFVNVATGTVLDLCGGTPSVKANIHAYIDNGTAAQKWFLRERTQMINEGYVTIASTLNSNMVLDVASGSTASGGNVQLYKSNATYSQKWYCQLVEGFDNVYTFRSLTSGLYLTSKDGNVEQGELATGGSCYFTAVSLNSGSLVLQNLASGDCIDVAGGSTDSKTNIQMHASNGTDAQRFTISSVLPLASGCYNICSYSDNNGVLDIANASTAENANVQIVANNNGKAQKFNIVSNSDGTYTIISVLSKKALDVAGGSAVSGTNVRVHTANGTAAQKWTLKLTGAKAFALVSALDPNLVLNVTGGGIYIGVNIDVATANGSKTQSWVFKETKDTVTLSEVCSLISNTYGSGLQVINGSYNFNSVAGFNLINATNAITNAGKSLGYVMIDLQTGEGISFNSDTQIYSASCIKGPYVAAINRYCQANVSASVRSTMSATIGWSSNEGYASLFSQFGTFPINMLHKDVGGVSYSSNYMYSYFSAKDLAKMWVGIYDYFFENTNSNSAWCASLYTDPYLSYIRSALKGRWTTYSKAGWINSSAYYTARNDGGIVMANGHPYIIAIMSTAYGMDGRLETLVRALDDVHTSMI